MLQHMTRFPSFSWLNEVPLYICHIFFIHSTIAEHDCSHLFSANNTTSKNMGMQRSLRDLDCNSFGCISRNEITGSCVVLVLIF